MASVSMSVVHGDGVAAIFWTDAWSQVGALNLFAPNLFNATSCAGRRRSLKDALHLNQWARDITGALTTQVLCQYIKVWEITRPIVLDPLRSDRFVWKWSADGHYSASSAYRAFFHGSSSLLGARELWRTRAPPKVKFFGWLALHKRLWTAARRKRHGLQAYDDCALCGQSAETVDHLLLGCVFTRQLWHALLAPMGLLSLVPQAEEDVAHWWVQKRLILDKASRPIFDTFLLISWNAWKHRNGIVFAPGTRPDVARAKIDSLREANDWMQAGYFGPQQMAAAWSSTSPSM